MPVFISHRTADDELAQQVHDRLTGLHQIKCYVDNIDLETQNTKEITALLVRRLKECTNLLALVTENTRGSWWVPFEVGVAREAPRMITTYTNLTQGQLPEYLTEWPVLRGEWGIDQFAISYKKNSPNVKRAFIENRATATEGFTGVEGFHRQLKAALGQ